MSTLSGQIRRRRCIAFALMHGCRSAADPCEPAIDLPQNLTFGLCTFTNRRRLAPGSGGA